MSKISYPIIIEEMPNTNIQKIKDRIYEGYAIISEESLLTNNFNKEFVEYHIKNFRARNFFVKRIYLKWIAVSSGINIIAFELVKLRDPIVETFLSWY